MRKKDFNAIAEMDNQVYDGNLKWSAIAARAKIWRRRQRLHAQDEDRYLGRRCSQRAGAPLVIGCPTIKSRGPILQA